MIKSILFLALLSVCFAAPLPVLHKITNYSFEQPYSCGGTYKTSALFFTSYGITRNSPELLFNSDGGCGNPYFQVMLSGDDFGFVGDFGELDIENVTAYRALVNNQDQSFTSTSPSVVGHTYVALLSRSDIRSLFTFTVLSYDETTHALSIEYAILSYSYVTETSSSPGWGWETPNSF